MPCVQCFLGTVCAYLRECVWLGFAHEYTGARALFGIMLKLR
jgi:hypothetical protein